MSIKYKIEFRVSEDPFLIPIQRDMAKKLGHFLANCTKWPKDPAYFTFIVLRQNFRVVTKKEIIRQLYINRMVISRTIEAYEESFYKELENNFDIAQKNNNFIKFISTIFEYYVEAKMQLLHGLNTFVSNNVLINGKKYITPEVKTVDLAIDKLDENKIENKILILAECCLTLRRLQSKAIQIDFYSNLLKTIRGIIGGSIPLQFEMIVAENDNRRWNQTKFQSFETLHDNDVKIYGKTLVFEPMVQEF